MRSFFVFSVLDPDPLTTGRRGGILESVGQDSLSIWFLLAHYNQDTFVKLHLFHTDNRIYIFNDC